MLTIDYLDEADMPAEKPNHRVKPVVYRRPPGAFDRLYAWAVDQQQDLLQAAHNARLLKLAKGNGAAIDGQRCLEAAQPGREILASRQIDILR